MLGFFKSLLRRPHDAAAERNPVVAHESVPAAKPGLAANQPPGAKPSPLRKDPTHHNGKGVEIPLQQIIDNLPLELKPRVTQSNVGDLSISVPLEKVLAQLSRGTVKVSFGELRQVAPEAFTLQNDRDRVLVSLPLSEILSRINPALITRRRAQRHIEVPEEISSPFDANGRNIALFTEPAQREPEPARPLPARHNGAAPPFVTPSPAPASPSGPPPSSVPSPFTFRPAFAEAPTPAPAAISPALAPSRFTAPAPPPAAPALTLPSVSASPAPIPFSRGSMAAPQTPASPSAGLAIQPSREAPARSFQSPPAAPPVPHPATPVPGIEPLLVGLAALAEHWPDAIRKEIIDLNLAEARTALPFSSVEQALKQGRISFAWKTIRGWIKPAVLPSVSAHDGAVLELPLKVVAPLFLARQKEHAQAKQKVSVDAEIPNLFFGFPQPEPAAPAAPAAVALPQAPRSADTNYYVWEEDTDLPKAQPPEARRGPTPGTKFVAKYATPNEVVSRAAGLDGVAGALIALPDGLMVANRLPPEVNADTLAAFLPQIFGKVSQCTKELRMGELNNLNFTVGNVPWKIFA